MGGIIIKYSSVCLLYGIILPKGSLYLLPMNYGMCRTRCEKDASECWEYEQIYGTKRDLGSYGNPNRNPRTW